MPTKNANTSSFNVKLIHALLQLAQHQGISVAKALKSSVIEHKDIDTPGQRYSINVFEKLLIDLTEQSNNQKLAILAAEATQPRMLGCLGFVMTTANSLQDAYQMLADYFSLIYEGVQLSVKHEKDNFIIELEFESDQPLVTEFFVGCLLNWPRWLTGRTIAAHSISFNFAEKVENNYHQQLATHINFDQPKNQLVFSNLYMSLACSEANPEMHQLHCNFADSLIYKSSQKQAIIAQTKYQIRKLIHEPKGRETLAIRRELIAQNLNMSLRTFQRKLNALDSNFQKIHDSVRHEICLQLIAQPEINFGQISYKLGFSNLSAFQKAFKRWMKTSPSEYKKNITSKQVIESKYEKTEPNRPSWFAALNTAQLDEAINTRISKLSSFSKQLLSLAALIQQVSNNVVSMGTLAKISTNSIARLSIYLWPAQQQELIANIDSFDTESIQVLFTPIDIIPQIIATNSERQTTEQHYSIGSFYRQQNNISIAFQHFLLCNISLLEKEQTRLIFKYCKEQITDISCINQHQVINNIYNLMIACKLKLNDDEELLNQLYIEQLEVWIELALFDAAHKRFTTLKIKKLTINQHVSLSIIASQLLVELNQVSEAQTLLLSTATTYCHISDSVDENSALLQHLSSQLEVVSNISDKDVAAFIQPEVKDNLSSFKVNQLRILQKTITICLHAHEPIKAAGAIAKMFELSLSDCDYFYSSFACAHFSWVCSSFSGDIEKAQLCSQRSMYLANEHSESQAKYCKLILSAKVYHWFQPLSLLKSNLAEIEHKDIKNYDKNIIQSKILLQYLDLCSGEPLIKIKHNCSQLSKQFMPASDQQATNTITDLIKTTQFLLNEDETDQAQQAHYKNSINAFTELFGAFYSFNYKLWPQMQNWDAKIESDITSNYITTEAVFICTLMRLHCLDDKPLNSTEKSRFDGYITRLKMWSKLCPENFSTQYKIAKAVYYSKFKSLEDSINEFESILETINHLSHIQHKILYYHYYALVLCKSRPGLSALCQEKKQVMLSIWKQPILDIETKS